MTFFFRQTIVNYFFSSYEQARSQDFSLGGAQGIPRGAHYFPLYWVWDTFFRCLFVCMCMCVCICTHTSLCVFITGFKFTWNIRMRCVWLVWYCAEGAKFFAFIFLFSLWDNCKRAYNECHALYTVFFPIIIHRCCFSILTSFPSRVKTVVPNS